jgi:hypothetical protein
VHLERESLEHPLWPECFVDVDQLDQGEKREEGSGKREAGSGKREAGSGKRGDEVWGWGERRNTADD